MLHLVAYSLFEDKSGVYILIPSTCAYSVGSTLLVGLGVALH